MVSEPDLAFDAVQFLVCNINRNMVEIFSCFSYVIRNHINVNRRRR